MMLGFCTPQERMQLYILQKKDLFWTHFGTFFGVQNGVVPKGWLRRLQGGSLWPVRASVTDSGAKMEQRARGREASKLVFALSYLGSGTKFVAPWKMNGELRIHLMILCFSR